MSLFFKLSPYFLLPFLKNDISVKDFIKLNSAFCSKVDRPKLTHLLIVECKVPLKSIEHSVLQASLRIKSSKLNTSEETVTVINVDSKLNSLPQIWDAFQRKSPLTASHEVNGIGDKASIEGILAAVIHSESREISGKGREYFILWSGHLTNGLALRKSLRSVDFYIDHIEFTLGTMRKGIYTVDISRKSENQLLTKRGSPGIGWKVDTYTGDLRYDLMTGFGTMKYHNGDLYVGAWNRSTRCGIGVFTAVKGDKYTGEWRSDNKNGEGEMRYANGDMYTGNWQDNQRSGHGKCIYSSNDVYTGTWRNDIRFGKGVLISANGDRLSGHWHRDGINCNGTIKYANGDTYTGKFVHNQCSGQGVLVDALTGDVYSGEWNAGRMCGRGEIKFTNGDKYFGSWSDHMRLGYGIMLNAYSTQWRCEYGSLTTHNGSEFSGVWLAYQPLDGGNQMDCKAVVIRDVSGDLYIGALVHGKKCGKCTVRHTNGDLFTGEWRCYVTVGEIKYADGTVYRGYVLNGQRCTPPHGGTTQK